ncbi:MAG: hypothetical protein JWM72_2779 [Actinomycetia bacterium]|nr:hypothetical protein [Actinomycetes bacterium]
MFNDRITFGVQADVTSSATEWFDVARRVEDAGFDALYVADHASSYVVRADAIDSVARIIQRLR